MDPVRYPLAIEERARGGLGRTGTGNRDIGRPSDPGDFSAEEIFGRLVGGPHGNIRFPPRQVQRRVSNNHFHLDRGVLRLERGDDWAKKLKVEGTHEWEKARGGK